MKSHSRWFLAASACLAASSFALVARAVDWYVVGGEAYQDSNGDWVAWISDADANDDGRHATVRGKSKRDAKKKAEERCDQMNEDGCFDPCMQHPEECAPTMSTSSADPYQLISVTETGKNQWTVQVGDGSENLVFVRATRALGLSDGATMVQSLNGGVCTAF